MCTVKIEREIAFIIGEIKQTGGSGIGQETTYTLAETGVAGIMVTGINVAKAKSTTEKSKQLSTNINYRAISIHADVTNAVSVQHGIDATVKEFRRIDYCINGAGIDVAKYFVPFDKSSTHNYDKARMFSCDSRGLRTDAIAGHLTTTIAEDLLSTSFLPYLTALFR
ncbi:hypothetical protein B0O99DRAFT_677040 [Bisporella sp. PMI_857]|nr:hypothetical protein B0O99DRAFT_677040 [Bisporella sp. PMI_857]